MALGERKREHLDLSVYITPTFLGTAESTVTLERSWLFSHRIHSPKRDFHLVLGVRQKSWNQKTLFSITFSGGWKGRREIL